MNWWTIVKQGKILTLPNPQLRIKKPSKVEEKDDCIKWLKGLYDIWNKHSQNLHSSQNHYFTVSEENHFNIVTEELACALKDYLLSFQGEYVSIHSKPFKYKDKEYYQGDRIDIDCYTADFISFLIQIWEGIDSLPDTMSVKMQIAWEELDVTDITSLTELNDAILEICKYINNKESYDYWHDHVIIMGSLVLYDKINGPTTQETRRDRDRTLLNDYRKIIKEQISKHWKTW